MTRTFADMTRMLSSLTAAALVVLAAAGTAAAQAPVPQAAVPSARNAIFFELGGNAILYSLNYDRRLNNTWTGRAGLMFVSATGQDLQTGARADVDLTVVPVMINALLGRGTHRFEIGAGPLFAIGGGEVEDAEIGDVEEFTAAGLAGVTSTIGYRRQPLDGGFVFRAGLVPFYSASFQIWAGLSAGWSF